MSLLLDFAEIGDGLDCDDQLKRAHLRPRPDITEFFDLSEANTKFIITGNPVLCYNVEYGIHFFLVSVNKIVSYANMFYVATGFHPDSHLRPHVNSFFDDFYDATYWTPDKIVLELFDPNFRMIVSTL